MKPQPRNHDKLIRTVVDIVCVIIIAVCLNAAMRDDAYAVSQKNGTGSQSHGLSRGISGQSDGGERTSK